MRGRLVSVVRLALAFGLTPANAGTTRRHTHFFTPTLAHPRECGDDITPLGDWATALGSPPRMRGRHAHGFGNATVLGLTPANAGTTPGSSIIN